ncbi:MAG: hypothetical protein AB8B48_07805 [Pseudomonadales bacterium]
MNKSASTTWLKLFGTLLQALSARKQVLSRIWMAILIVLIADSQTQ